MARSLSYFFPAYNEEGNLAPMVDRALEVLPRFAADFEVIIVDDGSRDGTEGEGRALAAIHPEVRYIRHPENRGYGEAVRTGLTSATRDTVLYTDGDQQFDLAELDRLWPRLDSVDVVAGYRIKRADPAHRLFIAWTYNRVLRVLFGLRVRDVDCAFKLMRTEVARAVRPESGGAFFSAEFLLRARHAGYTLTEVGVNHFPRLLGSPKGATPAVILRTFREMFRLRGELRRARGAVDEL
ncbi:MAG: glycosyltransferase family 2 protein [Candidatus Dormibacteria bacterium]